MISSERTQTKSASANQVQRKLVCDRCGAWMLERQCKVICPNCGCQLDCSDLTIYFDEFDPARVEILMPPVRDQDEKGS